MRTSVIVRTLFFSIGLSLLAACAPNEQEPESFTARQILTRMGTVYANCKSYRDSGVVITTYIDASINIEWSEVEASFTTAFIRSGRFRLEYRETNGGPLEGHIIWCRDNDIREWWDATPGVSKMESLGLAMAGFTGSSDGAVDAVASLLLPKEVGGLLLTQLTEAERLVDAEFEEVDCFRIRGKHVVPTTLWVGKSDFLLRRVDERWEIAGFPEEEVTTVLRPQIDVRITEEMLEFNPPVGGDA